MSHEFRLCPECKCPIPAPPRAASGLACPRCNRWLEIDPSCTGGCLSCHRKAAASATGSCATNASSAESVPVSIEKSHPDRLSSERQCGSNVPKVAGSLWKRLLKGIFAVR